MPLLPDNYHTVHEPFTTTATLTGTTPGVANIVAADPEKVAPAGGLAAVSGIGLDGVDMKFVHGEENASWQRGSGHGMLRDIWGGMK